MSALRHFMHLSRLEHQRRPSQLHFLPVLIDLKYQVILIRGELHQESQSFRTQQLCLYLMRTQVTVEHIVFPIQLDYFFLRSGCCLKLLRLLREPLHRGLSHAARCRFRSSRGIEPGARMFSHNLDFGAYIHVVLLDHGLFVDVAGQYK